MVSFHETIHTFVPEERAEKIDLPPKSFLSNFWGHFILSETDNIDRLH